MSLQTRLASFIQAVGADIKDLKAKFTNPALVGFGQLEPHSTYTDFNQITDFGWHYVQGTTNGPNIPGGIQQYYVQSVSLGSEYPFSQYAMQVAYKRNVPGSKATRFREGGTWGPWASEAPIAPDMTGTAIDGGSPYSYTPEYVLDGGAP